MKWLFGDPIENFWKYVSKTLSSQTCDALNANRDAREKFADGCSKRLDNINASLGFEFGKGDDGKGQFAVSACGIKKVFPVVRHVMDRAPVIPNWTIVAFKQRLKEMPTVDLGAISVGPDKVSWVAAVFDHELALQIWIDVPQDVPKDILTHLKFIFLDAALGEVDVSSLGVLEVVAGVEKGARPLTELPAFFDSWSGRSHSSFE